MKRNLIWLLLAVMMLALTGCGSSSDDRGIFTESIASDAAFDGDIFESLAGDRTVTLSGGGFDSSVLVGLDSTGEYRAFLNFPLERIPANAVIRSATLSFNLIPPIDDIPIEMDLVSFPPSGLSSLYYDDTSLPPLATARYSLPVSSFNTEQRVSFDVTTLMVAAQAQIPALDYFQLRIMEDLDFSIPGLIEIDEWDGNPPRLTVVYF